MNHLKCKIGSVNSDQEFDFECYSNTEPIEIGDYFLFFFAGSAEVGKCESESEKLEINPHCRQPKKGIIDLTHTFWQHCFKIKTTDFDFSLL